MIPITVNFRSLCDVILVGLVYLVLLGLPMVLHGAMLEEVFSRPGYLVPLGWGKGAPCPR